MLGSEYVAMLNLFTLNLDFTSLCTGAILANCHLNTVFGLRQIEFNVTEYVHAMYM